MEDEIETRARRDKASLDKIALRRRNHDRALYHMARIYLRHGYLNLRAAGIQTDWLPVESQAQLWLHTKDPGFLKWVNRPNVNVWLRGWIVVVDAIRLSSGVETSFETSIRDLGKIMDRNKVKETT
jgi:hypothetical protein